MFHKSITLNSLNHIESANTAKLISMYKKVLLKIRKCDCHIWFNIQCKKRRMFPNYIHIYCKNSTWSANRAVHIAKWNWLLCEIKKWFTVKRNLEDHAKFIHLELSSKLHPVEFDIIDEKIRNMCYEESYKVMLKKQKKLRELELNRISNSSNIHNVQMQTNNSTTTIQTATSHQNTTLGNDTEIYNEDQHKNTQKCENNTNLEEITFFPKVLNRSNVSFNTQELQFLNKGIKYSPTSKINFKDYIYLAVDTELNTLNESTIIKSECARKIDIGIKDFNKNNKKKKKHNKEKRILHSIKEKIDSNKLVVTKADKGNTLVILHDTEYKEKMYQFITSSGAIETKKDPTLKFQSTIRNACKKFNILKKNYNLINMNPKAPTMYGLLKLHKEDCPIRPVVSYNATPAYNLCKLFNNLFINFTSFHSKCAIKNSLELINNIKDINIPDNSILVSFDVKNLFPSIPVIELKNIAYQHIDKNIHNEQINLELKQILDIVIEQNYLKFDNKFYKLNDGLVMGSPSSPLLAEVYMDNFEEVLLSNQCPFYSKILFWYRYVDDVIALWQGSDIDLDTFLSWLNKCNSKIQFTVEKEYNNALNFLDLTITKNNNKFEFNIYRKPSYSDSIIPSDSNHPFNIKVSAFNSMVYRLLNIPLSQSAFKKEVNIIKKIANNNGYSSQLIDRLIHKSEKRLIFKKFTALISYQDPNDKKFVKLPFINKTSYSVANILKKNCNLNVAFYNKKILRNILFNCKEKNDKFKTSGVYKIKCDNCKSIYIGQTGREIGMRFQEHLTSYKNNKIDSAVAKHLLEYGHSCTIDNLSILHVEKKGRRLDLLENFEIERAKKKDYKNVLNEQLEFTLSPILSQVC